MKNTDCWAQKCQKRLDTSAYLFDCKKARLILSISFQLWFFSNATFWQTSYKQTIIAFFINAVLHPATEISCEFVKSSNRAFQAGIAVRNKKSKHSSKRLLHISVKHT